MTKADFYVGTGSDARWIGSIGADGYPASGVISPEIFLQVNKIMFEEMVLDLLRKEKQDDWAAIADEGDPWPWLWLNSQITDYTYMFDEKLEKVIASKGGEEFFDPIKIIQGEDMNSAELGIGRPRFPQMSFVIKDGSRLTTTL